jgi:hypothetical protein
METHPLFRRHGALLPLFMTWKTAHASLFSSWRDCRQSTISAENKLTAADNSGKYSKNSEKCHSLG